MLRLEHVSLDNDRISGEKRLDDISFTIAKGEVLGLVGESGSGKSTLAHAILGFTPIEEGRIIWKGRTINGPTVKKGWLASFGLCKRVQNYEEQKDLYKDIQYIFQNPQSSFNPRQSLGNSLRDTLRYSCAMRGPEAEARLDRALGQVGLPVAYKDKLPSQVSGGECQRAALARALLIGPSLLICDEITSALDGQTERDILVLLKNIQANTGMAILFISHDIALVSRFTDRLLILRQGQILEEGSTQEVLQNPKHAYTQLLWDAAFLNEK